MDRRDKFLLSPRLALLLGGDEVDDVRFRLHLPNDLADLFLPQLGLGEADAVELASQRSLNHGGLVGTRNLVMSSAVAWGAKRTTE